MAVAVGWLVEKLPVALGAVAQEVKRRGGDSSDVENPSPGGRRYVILYRTTSFPARRRERRSWHDP